MYVGDAASHGLEIVVSGVQVLLKQVETWRKLVTDCLQDIGGQRGFRRRARRGHRKNFLPQGKKGLGRLGQREHLLSADLLLCKRREMLTRVTLHGSCLAAAWQLLELELELIQTQMAQKPMLRAEVGMRVRCANKASAE